MLITTAESACLIPGLDSDCALPGSDSAFAAGELVCVLGVAVLEPVFGVAGLELVGPPVNSDCAGALAAPVPLESVLVCALAGKASITTKKGTITRLRKCLRKATKHMSSPRCAETNTVNIIMSPFFVAPRMAIAVARQSAGRAVLLGWSGADVVRI